LWLSGCGKQRRGKRPNIFLVTVDALRADHLSCYGYCRDTSPNIDRFARDALLFENCFSHAPATSPSCASLLSGFLPHETTVLINSLPLPEGVEILPEILQRHGYQTVAVVSNYVLRRRMGWAQGSTVFDDTMDDCESGRGLPERIAERTTGRAIELLDQLKADPLFMWIHYQDPHGPYTPPERFSGLSRDRDQEPRHLKVNSTVTGWGGIPSYQKLAESTDYHYYVSQYDAEIRYQDEHFKRLIEAVKRLGLYDDALIVLSSDHGEGMGEHGYYFAHGEHLYSSLTHVPLIVKCARSLTGRRTDFVQHIDVAPTALAFAGIKLDPRFRGRDLRRQYATQSEIFAVIGDIVSMTYGGFRLVYTIEDNDYELFDIRTDSHGEHNLIRRPEYRDRVNDLIRRLRRIGEHDSLGLDIINRPPELTDEEKRKLRSIGYAR